MYICVNLLALLIYFMYSPFIVIHRLRAILLCTTSTLIVTQRSYTDKEDGYSDPNDLDVKVHNSYTFMTSRSPKEKAVVKVLGLLP